jgi:hypothetical protein
MNVTEDQPEITSLPKWVATPSEFCGSRYLCASASGLNLADADLSAKKNLASIFETHISSKTRQSTSAYGSEVDLTQIFESVELQVQESVDLVLKNVAITDRYQDQESFNALARLDRSKAERQIRNDIFQIDQHLGGFMKLKRKILYRRALIMLEKRLVLNQYLNLVSDRMIAEKYSLADINRLRFSQDHPAKVKLHQTSDFSPLAAGKVTNLLTESGYKIVTTQDSDYHVYLRQNKKEEHLNVEGFQKFTFHFEFEGKNNLQQKVGAFDISKVTTGRNRADAFLKIKDELLSEIEQKIDQLNFD